MSMMSDKNFAYTAAAAPLWCLLPIHDGPATLLFAARKVGAVLLESTKLLRQPSRVMTVLERRALPDVLATPTALIARLMYGHDAPVFVEAIDITAWNFFRKLQIIAENMPLPLSTSFRGPL